MRNKKLAIYALHPIMYQTPIFKELTSSILHIQFPIEVKVLFGSDLSLKEMYFEEINTTFKPDTPSLLEGYPHKFLKNYAKDERGGFFSRMNFGIFRELFCERYDAILIHGYESLTAWLILIVAKLSGTKILWRGEAVLRGIENNASLKQRVKKVVLKYFFKGCDAVMYSCSGNKYYLQFYGVEDKKLFSIPCAVNNQFFQDEKVKYEKNKKQIKRELEIDSDDMVILFSARFTKRKRPLDLLRAVASIEHSKITILFVGNGPEYNSMQEFAVENHLKTVFTGFKNQSELAKYYSIADVDIVISDYDPSPKAMNEAMNFSLPIIVTDVVGTAYDLVEDGKNGFIIKVGDIDILAKKLDYLMKHKEKISEFGKKSLEIVNQWNYIEDAKGILQAFEYTQKR